MDGPVRGTVRRVAAGVRRPGGLRLALHGEAEAQGASASGCAEDNLAVHPWFSSKLLTASERFL